MRIASHCNLTCNPKLRQSIVDKLNEGGQLQGLPLNSEFLFDYAIPLIQQLKGDLTDKVIRHYADALYA